MTRIALDIPSGLFGDDTAFASQGKWKDASNFRWVQGKAQIIGGWESLTTTLLTGVCRKAFPWTDNAGALNVGFGTHSNLEVYVGGGLYDITPTLALSATLLGTNPLTTVNTSPTVTVSHPHHGLSTGDSVSFSGAAVFNNVTITGAYTITVTTTDAYTITAGTNANASGSGGGSAVVAAPQTAFAAGAIDGTGTAGYGTGAYGTGTYGTPSTADYFPRTWSMGAWGKNLLACPRGGAIHAWTNNTGTVAAPLQNAPAQVTYVLVAPNGGAYQAFALGCSQEADGVFNPMCIRHCSIRNNTEWFTDPSTTAREYTLAGGGRIVAGAVFGAYLLVWTNEGLFLGQYVGQLNQPWRFDKVASNCGLMGPNAFAVKGQEAFWVSPDRQFYRYAIGGTPTPVPCPIREDFAENLTPSQMDKVTAATLSEFGEVWWFYPDVRDGLENSRYLALTITGPDLGKWFRGQLARTAFCDAGVASYPIGTTYDGNAYFHEKGWSADGNAWSGFIETADLYLDENMVMNVGPLWPDFVNQQGAITVTTYTALYPQGAETVSGPTTIAAGTQKVDLRVMGRLLRVRLDFNSTVNQLRLGKIDVDVTPGGLR
jgi:hypothetical protein